MNGDHAFRAWGRRTRVRKIENTRFFRRCHQPTYATASTKIARTCVLFQSATLTLAQPEENEDTAYWYSNISALVVKRKCELQSAKEFVSALLRKKDSVDKTSASLPGSAHSRSFIESVHSWTARSAAGSARVCVRVCGSERGRCCRWR